MAAFSSLIAVAGLAAGAAGSVMQYQAQNAAARRSEALSQASQDLQSRQLQVQEGRQKRQAYRDMLKAQAATEANAGAQGGLASSAVQGGLGQAANSFAQTNQNITENGSFAREGMFISNLNQRNRASQTGNLVSGIGGGLTALAGTRAVQSMGRLF